jgi:hypothetical protein
MGNFLQPVVLVEVAIKYKQPGQQELLVKVMLVEMAYKRPQIMDQVAAAVPDLWAQMEHLLLVAMVVLEMYLQSPELLYHMQAVVEEQPI